MSAKAVKKTVIRKSLADVKTSYYVRAALNEDRVQFFMQVYDGGGEIELPTIEAETDEMVDGRHRKAALERLGRKMADFEVVPRFENPTELMMEAYSSNVGGALPPTAKDTIFLMKQFIESGMKTKELGGLFAPYYPPSVVRRYVSDAYSAVNKSRMQRAVSAVIGSRMTVNESATEHNVDLDDLKKEIGGARRKNRRTGLTEIKAVASARYRGHSQKTQSLLRHMLDDFEDGKLDEKDVEAIFKLVEKFNTTAVQNLKNWRERFAARKRSMQEQ